MQLQRRFQRPGPLSAVVGAGMALAFTVAVSPLPAQTRFSDARMIFEVNSTDGDAGIQVFLDGDEWRTVAMTDPGGREILEVTNKGRLANVGLTELFVESQEPSFDEVPLREFLQKFPAGEYRFRGITVEGEAIVASATLTHRIPEGPVIVAPEPDAVLRPDGAVIEWRPVTRPRGIEIVRYQVIVELEEPSLLGGKAVFSVDLPATVTSLRLPREFLQFGKEYKFEVLAIEAGGNQTISEASFETVPFRP
ncbi:MAG: hypothetical protein H0V09_02075 [Gemmatimonadetes bacterium]|nr:hypothetical protein [Gemmatimonadota bacterium]